MNNSEREIKEETWYKHYKGGIYYVKGKAKDINTKETVVIYCGKGNQNNLFTKPLKEFSAKVNKEAFPSADQEYKYEEIVK